MKTVKDVEPFKVSYRAFHKPTGVSYGEFDSIKEAWEFISPLVKRVPHWHYWHYRGHQRYISHTLRLEPDDRYGTNVENRLEDGSFSRKTIYTIVPAPAYVILTDLGEVVGKEEFLDATSRPYRQRFGYKVYEAKREALGKHLVRVSHSPKKIKASCRRALSAWRDSGYDNVIRGYFRAIKTAPEIRINEGHINEYEREYGPLVRGHRRLLPDNYCDRNCSANDTDASWKHNSKRRKQWIPK